MKDERINRSLKGVYTKKGLFNNLKNKLTKGIENGNRDYGPFYLSFLFTFTLVIFILGCFPLTVHAKSINSNEGTEAKLPDKVKKKPDDILEGAEWKFFKGDKKPESKWNHVGAGDKDWFRGKSGFGYGNSKSRTNLSDMKGKYDSIYVCHEFTVDDPHAIKGMTLTIDSDGAFIAYLNGIEVIRSKVKMNEELDISGFVHELFPGTNAVCIQGFNDRIDSDNFTFIPTLKFVGE